MVLDKQRKNFDPILLHVANIFIKIKPNYLSWLSVLFAFSAGACFYISSPEFEMTYIFLLIASISIFLNGFFDAIDGKVAKITNKTSDKGDFLDHALDRYADVFIVGGLSISSWCRYPSIGLVAMIGILLTSYMGTQAQAIGYKRIYTGLLGRADRLFILIFAPIFQYILIHYSIVDLIFELSLLEWVLVYFALIGNLTALQRFYTTLVWFKKKN